MLRHIQNTGQLSEDEQIMQAIALSLGQEVSVDDKAKEEEEAKKKEKEEKELQRQKERELMTPVSKEELDEFSDILLAGCLELCDTVNDSVVGICDLISAVGKRNEDEWREKALVQIKEKVC
jgi:E3 ubiquitin-protein ligase HUWE1